MPTGYFFFWLTRNSQITADDSVSFFQQTHKQPLTIFFELTTFRLRILTASSDIQPVAYDLLSTNVQLTAYDSFTAWPLRPRIPSRSVKKFTSEHFLSSHGLSTSYQPTMRFSHRVSNLQHANYDSLTAILNRVRFFLDLATISHPTAAVTQILELSSGMREFESRLQQTYESFT